MNTFKCQICGYTKYKILHKQNKTDLSLAQYNKALEKYNDETSKSIISMKIANIGKKVDK